MKKIAVFMGDTSGEFQGDVVEAVEEVSRVNGMDIVVFSNAGVYGNNAFYTQGEKNVINVPYLEDYEGVIVAGDTFGIDTMYEELAELLEKEAKCPVICLRQKDERFSNVLVDDYSAMCTMVEHFIVDHGFQRISFMTGKLEMYDAQRRLLAYINTMHKYGYEVTPEMIFEGDYWCAKGDEAVAWLLKDENHMPQAIVCANDYMAISVCNSLYKKGIRIPEQICVSGYDDIEEAGCSIPPLSTMRIPAKELGITAFRLIQELNETKEKRKDVYVEVTPVFRGSCCRGIEWEMDSAKKLILEKEYIKDVFYSHTSMSIAFNSEDDFSGLIRTAHDYIKDRGYEKIFICMCNREEVQQEGSALQQRYSEKMVLRAVISAKDWEICEEHFERRDILPPKYLQKEETIYVHPFHGQNHCLGYVVLKTKDLSKLRYFMTRWVQAMGSSLERQIMYEESRELMELRKNYNKDPLTGIGNRREIDKAVRDYCAKLDSIRGFCIISLDMDDLKVINDNYGHLEGDVALCALAHILKGIVGAKGVAARIGGDEYLICLKSNVVEEVEELLEEIRHRIAYYNNNSGKEWKLSTSIGYAFCRNKNSVLLCMQQADKNMYEEKRIKKSNRK